MEDDGATALQPISPDRVNHQNPIFASVHRDSDVHDKIRQFNNMAGTAASMSKQLERMTADAALKRAMIGREEAETSMRRYREEAHALRKQIEEGRERERKVGERLETVMENYGRAKETYSHTQALWEKEIRRARKETFKSQSSIVKLQEELKAARVASKSAEECLQREKDLSKAREQEAFQSRYQLVGLQEELEKAREQISFLEAERDAFKTAAKSEEVARLAMEGRLPLPPEDPFSEFASPQKEGRVSISTYEVTASAATEAEIDELKRLWQWEKQRADRAEDHIEFVKLECQLQHSSRPTKRSRTSTVTTTSPRKSPRKERPAPLHIIDPSDHMILGTDVDEPASSTLPETSEPVEDPKDEDLPTVEPETEEVPEEVEQQQPRRATVFVPAEGVFRTISQQDLEAMESNDDDATLEPPTPVQPEPHMNPLKYSRTPSVDPPAFALMVQERTSLLSLLNAPHENDDSQCAFDIPSTTAEEILPNDEMESETTPQPEETTEHQVEIEEEYQASPEHNRPHTSAAFYTEITTTTTVPIHEENTAPHTAPITMPSQYQGQHHHGRTPSFDVTNPALTPTMTREEALAQIKERRGRARSAMQGAMTPRKQMVSGVAGERRDVSAPQASRAGITGTGTGNKKAVAPRGRSS
ncbi:hypothetical protein F5Y16DRAFT_338511 [Xylariaceae sp. FL0255]|nr:hypothetical protein F5Y16DRAFT_338511 [Xylariaceae sp. FL0255]